eukprot:CAMPEP_0179420886 /NCGR_PEP_ID=MMETSP0799-20121207/9436_1 /TAXON_ID=46947 /ORGANISM="Geminigera cryophila, Strain CCMP2564" /LENGTH=280 /DNA_ID=CAMNT_0021194585 /DNA_START=26 /DNA_END=865 /DNA_ORIENTATION=+
MSIVSCPSGIRMSDLAIRKTASIEADSETVSPSLLGSRTQAWPTSKPFKSLNDSLLDSANAARNLQENFSEEQAQTWLEHRNAVLSELNLSVWPLLKTLLFELLPKFMSGPICFLIEGPQATKNRGLNPLAGVTNPLNLLWLIPTILIFDAQGLILFLMAFWGMLWKDLPVSAPFEIFGMIFLATLARAMIIAVKYSLKSDLLMVHGQLDDCLFNAGYAATKQGERGQMNVYVMNASDDNLQKDELINMLYKSCLIANTDLSCCCVTWNPPMSIAGRTTK